MILKKINGNDDKNILNATYENINFKQRKQHNNQTNKRCMQ